MQLPSPVGNGLILRALRSCSPAFHACNCCLILGRASYVYLRFILPGRTSSRNLLRVSFPFSRSGHVSVNPSFPLNPRYPENVIVPRTSILSAVSELTTGKYQPGSVKRAFPSSENRSVSLLLISQESSFAPNGKWMSFSSSR